MASDVAELVDSVLASVPDALSSCCDRATILSGLDAAGACSVSMLRALVEQDYDSVKQALAVPVAKAAFAAALKQEVLSSGAAPAMPAAPAGAAFQTPSGAQPAHATPQSAAPTSLVTTVKVGTTAVVTARMITTADTTSFAELLSIAIANQPEEERSKMAALPVTVALYSSPQHLSTQKADVELSAPVSGSASLGYRHVVFSHAPPAQQPAARPSASAFDPIMGGNVLPDLETGDGDNGDDASLSFDKSLFNWLVKSCQEDGLGVQGDEKRERTLLIKAVRDALQAIDGREGSFQYSRVPEWFKAYKIRDGAIRRAKKPSKSRLASNDVRGYADKLRDAIDRHAFTKSPRWKVFIGNCDELCSVRMLKYESMRGAATAQAQRNSSPTVNRVRCSPPSLSSSSTRTRSRRARCRPAPNAPSASRPRARSARARSARAASTTTRPRASARSAGQRPRTRTGAAHGAAPSASRRARRRSASRSCSPCSPCSPRGGARSGGADRDTQT